MDVLNSYFLDLLKVTEQSALACYPFIGRGDSMGADKAAVDKMRLCFQELPLDVQIVIGEGERDQAPRLYTGEKLGDSKSEVQIDVAVDPLEGTSICAEGRQGAFSVMAVSLRGGLFKAPDIYMKKIACGPEAKGSIHLDQPVKKNILSVAKTLGKKPEDICVGVLNRQRHEDLIQEIRSTGASVQLVGDGDVSLSLETALGSSLDLLMGTGGAPEGVLSAAALKCLGGDFQGQLVYKNDEERERAQKAGVKDLDQILARDDLASAEKVAFFATGVTTGVFLEGISKNNQEWTSHSLVLSSQKLSFIKNKHWF